MIGETRNDGRRDLTGEEERVGGEDRKARGKGGKGDFKREGKELEEKLGRGRGVGRRDLTGEGKNSWEKNARGRKAKNKRK